MRRCEHQQCRRFAIYNVEGSKAAVFCKQHAVDGMVDVCNKRCSHDRCTKRPSFFFEGTRTAMFCKQHAEDGMVSIKYTLCSHDSCSRQPSFNFEGYKTPMYCKEHAEDGMVHVHQKRCSHDSCLKSPSFNVWGSTTAVYCQQHSEDGMVNVHSKRCSYDSCRRHAYYNVESSTTPAYCHQHAEEEMVHVRSKRSLHGRYARNPARILPTNVAATACTRPKNNRLDGSVSNSDLSSEVMNCRKRSRRELDGKPPPNALDHSPFKEDLIQTAETGRSKKVSHTSYSTVLRRHLGEDTVGMSTKQSWPVVPLTMAPLPHEHQSEEPIKTEMELDVLF